jgi:tetratricopeptide (TPR) repeat protein
MAGTSTDRAADASAAARASRYLLALAIAGSALAAGTVHTITLCVVTGVLVVAAVLGSWVATPMRARSAATLLLVTGTALTLYTALQCVPMPVRWLAAIAPYNADVWSRALAPLQEPGPTWAPISLDPMATRVEVLKGTCYLLAFVTALWIARRREGAAFLSATIVVTGLALAVAAVLHPAFGAHKLFGVYAPGPGVAERHIAPLLDPNSLAGYLNVAICISLAALLAPEPRVPRPIACAVMLLLVAVQVWIASRGGVVCMGLGAIVVIGIARVARGRRTHAGGALSLVSGVAAAVGAAFMVLGKSDEAASELLDANVSKFRMISETMRVAWSTPWVGCGRGAFESVFSAFKPTMMGHYTYAYPENVVAQWLGEWGLPVGIAGLALVAFALRPNVALARSTTADGAWAALVALAVQNLAELGTELPGLMLAGVVCGAIVTAGSSGNAPSWQAEKWSQRPRRIAVIGAAAAAAVLAFVGLGLGGQLHDDQRALHDAASRPASVTETHTLARAAMLRHPAEPYLPFITALRAARNRDDNPMPWIGAALERAEVYAQTHLVLARVVAQRSPSQARLEYRLAMEQWPDLVSGLMASEAPHVVGGYYDALELAPPGPAGVPILEALAETIEPRLPATQAMLDDELMSRAPRRPGPALRRARDAVADLEAGDGAPWCTGSARSACLRDALEKAAGVERIEPDMCEGYALDARARAVDGQTTLALAELAKAADIVTDRVPCLKELVAIARAAGDARRADEILDKITEAGCADDAECARTLGWVADQNEVAGNAQKALALYKRAYQRAPDDDGLLQHIAGLSASAGLHGEAAGDYERLARKHPDEPRWRRAAEAEHDAAMRGAVRL